MEKSGETVKIKHAKTSSKKTKKKSAKKTDNFKVIKGTNKKNHETIKWIDFITIANAIMGFLAILFTVQGLYDGNPTYFEYAILLIFVGIGLDIIDGRTARFFAQDSLLGKEIDSLADVITFVLAPMIFIVLYNFYLTRVHNPILLLAATLYIATGIMRLAKFNVNEFKGYFIGMPTPMAAFLVVLLFYTIKFAIMWPAVVVILGLAMISPIKIKKP